MTEHKGRKVFLQAMFSLSLAIAISVGIVSAVKREEREKCVAERCEPLAQKHLYLEYQACRKYCEQHQKGAK